MSGVSIEGSRQVSASTLSQAKWKHQGAGMICESVARRSLRLSHCRALPFWQLARPLPCFYFRPQLEHSGAYRARLFLLTPSDHPTRRVQFIMTGS